MHDLISAVQEATDVAPSRSGCRGDSRNRKAPVTGKL